jgi:hypothetical protein
MKFNLRCAVCCSQPRSRCQLQPSYRYISALRHRVSVTNNEARFPDQDAPGSMDIGRRRGIVIGGLRDAGTVHHMKEHTGIILTTTTNNRVGNCTKVTGTVMNTVTNQTLMVRLLPANGNTVSADPAARDGQSEVHNFRVECPSNHGKSLATNFHGMKQTRYEITQRGSHRNEPGDTFVCLPVVCFLPSRPR